MTTGDRTFLSRLTPAPFTRILIEKGLPSGTILLGDDEGGTGPVMNTPIRSVAKSNGRIFIGTSIALPDNNGFNGGVIEIDLSGNRSLLFGQAYVDDGTVENVIEVLPSNTDSVFLDGIYGLQDGGNGDLVFTMRWGPLLVYRYDLDTGELFVLADLEAQLDPAMSSAFEPTGLVIFKASQCPADLDGDGIVGPIDLATLLGNWGPCPDPPTACPADIQGTGDGIVGPGDLAVLLGAWGPCE